MACLLVRDFLGFGMSSRGLPLPSHGVQLQLKVYLRITMGCSNVVVAGVFTQYWERYVCQAN